MDFQCKSSMGVLDSCVGALDGWLCCIKVPISTDTANIAAHFSGHYQHHGVYVQACCDSKFKFTFLSVRSPGGTGDSRGFYGTALKHFWKLSLMGFYVVADSAYTLSSSLFVPFAGVDKRKGDNDIFNFHLSQLRIKIEQSFGLVVKKWRVFK
jgi:hypothetical protein